MDLDSVLKSLHKKAQLVAKCCPDDLPEVDACTDGNYFSEENLKKKKDFLHIMNWTTSFFTGMALLAYESSGDLELLKFAKSKNGLYYNKVFNFSNDTMHDLGFLYLL